MKNLFDLLDDVNVPATFVHGDYVARLESFDRKRGLAEYSITGVEMRPGSVGQLIVRFRPSRESSLPWSGSTSTWGTERHDKFDAFYNALLAEIAPPVPTRLALDPHDRARIEQLTHLLGEFLNIHPAAGSETLRYEANAAIEAVYNTLLAQEG